MSVQRIMGLETEYGITCPGQPRANPVALSAAIVTAYRETAGGAGARRARWNYDDEDPLLDARGFRLNRAAAHPSQLTDDPAVAAPSGEPDGAREPQDVVVTAAARMAEVYEDPGAANVILTNGGRLYVDHAHPEYSTPEVDSARDAVLWDRAGEEIMLRAARAVAASPGGMEIGLYKNNVDGKGATYGAHENYLLNRDIPFDDVVRFVTPFFVTRQVFTGAGRVGIGPTGGAAGFQLSQRADYIEAEVGLETTLRRPIVNTRDEPHADAARFRRLHVINGDATMLEPATLLRVGTAALVMWAMENMDLDDTPLGALTLADPVGEFRAVSHDLTLSHQLQLANGAVATAVQIQGLYVKTIAQELAARQLCTGETADIVERWAATLDGLAGDPMSQARSVEWVAKLRLMGAMARRDNLAWDHPRLAAMDVQWSDIRPERGLYHKLAAAGAVERLTTDAQVRRAVDRPPASTRAFFRGSMLREFAPFVVAASWDSVVVDVPGQPMLQRLAMADPYKGTAALVGPLFEASSDVGDLLARLRGA